MAEKETLRKFLSRLEGYYGKYNPTMREDLERWAEQLHDDELRGTYQKAIESYSSQYGRPPDVSVVSKALKEYREEKSSEIGDYLSLPDPDLEERKRTLTEEDKIMGASFVSKLFEGLTAGRHPVDAYEDWAYENADWVEENLGPVQDVVRRMHKEYEEKGGSPDRGGDTG